MGLFDRLTFEDGLDIEFPAIGSDPFDITWQTKSIARHPPMMDTYKVTSEARLLKEAATYERVPEEDRPGYSDEIGGFEHEIDGLRGAITKVDQEWLDMEYHGTFEFHRTIDGDYISLEATFTDGQLVAITAASRRV